MEGIIKKAELTKTMIADNIQSAQQRCKSQYDKKTRQPKYREGQQGLLQCSHSVPGLSAKLQQTYDGPYYITKILPKDVYYVLRHCQNNKLIKSPVNAMRLRPYFSPDDVLYRPTDPPEAPALASQANTPVPSQTDTSPSSDSQPQPPVPDTASIPQPSTSATGSGQSLPYDSEEGTDLENQSQSSEDEIYFVERILACKTINKVKHYKIKWSGHKNATWEPSHIPAHLIRDFHAEKTNCGRKGRLKVTPKNRVTRL
ncbi:hypothetical protein ACOMHN_027274 [Nucella lapillus]